MRLAGIVLGVVLASTPVTAAAQELVDRSPVAPAADAVSGKRGVLVPMYVSFAVLQALDMKSTRTALGQGGREANPVMTGMVGNPAAFFALKAATGAAVIFATERMRPRNRIAAIATMAALNSLYATIVTHNYAVAGR